MSMPSYSDVFSISHERDYDEAIHPGDLVRTGENLHPHFCVIAVSGDKVWLRNISSGADSLGQLNRCRRLEQEPVALAAE